ncbi:MAG: hypothetical protein KC478_13870 [Bacteriovoracaceae bacterium]|nr:hypothetical protein [Bacteriovoracaceae bacterium]
MNIKGSLGVISASEIKGWAINEDSPNQRVHLELVVNGATVDEVVANEYREDLKKINKGDGNLGFRFSGDYSKALDIKVMVKNSNIQLKRPNKSIILLLARQRSGTNVLRRCLSTHNKVFSINEIFDTGIYNNKTFEIYRNKYLELISENKSDLIGSYYSYHFDCMDESKKPITHLESFEKYINFIKDVSPNENIIIDVKYNHIRNLHGFITPLTEGVPELFKIVRRNNWKVLNLTRKNYLKTFVSGVLAAKTGAFVIDKNSKFNANETTQLDINTENMMTSLKQMQREDDFIYQHLNSYTNYFQIDYGEMFAENNDFDKNFLNKMADFLRVDNSFEKAPLLKKLQTRTVQDIVTNYNEVSMALKDSPFASQLEEY